MKNKKRKFGEVGQVESEEEEKKKERKLGEVGQVESEEKKKKEKKETQRPNYFVSLPITNTKITEAVSELQEAVLQKEPRLAKAMIPVASLHITLLVTHLANQEQVNLAAHALSQVRPSLVELLGGRDLVLPFAGIGQFRSEVAFVSLTPGTHSETLTQLTEVLRRRFEEQGLSSGDRQDFKPHLTFMKLSKAPRLRSQGLRRLDPALWSHSSSSVFGEQAMERLDLCSMMKKKLPNGYYHTESTLDVFQTPRHGKRISVGRRAEPDEEELLKVSQRLVDEAVTRALQQFKQETHPNGGGATPTDPPPQPAGNAPATTINTQTTSPSSPLIVNAAMETTQSKLLADN
ncbi:A-kinase anchor protein 7 [Aplochiton taeniatus]